MPNDQAAGPLPDRQSAMRRTASLSAITGGLLASSCCILPLALVSIGVGGAWMSTLTALAPYQPIFLTITGVSIVGGFWLSRRARNKACAIDGPCAKTITQKRYSVGLWIGGALAVTAIVLNGLAPLLY